MYRKNLNDLIYQKNVHLIGPVPDQHSFIADTIVRCNYHDFDSPTDIWVLRESDQARMKKKFNLFKQPPKATILITGPRLKEFLDWHVVHSKDYLLTGIAAICVILRHHPKQIFLSGINFYGGQDIGYHEKKKSVKFLTKLIEKKKIIATDLVKSAILNN